MKGKFIPETPGENVPYPGKKYPDPDRPEIKFPDPPRPENIFTNVPRPGPVSVRSSPVRGNSGFRVAPQVFNCNCCFDGSITWACCRTYIYTCIYKDAQSNHDRLLPWGRQRTIGFSFVVPYKRAHNQSGMGRDLVFDLDPLLEPGGTQISFWRDV